MDRYNLMKKAVYEKDAEIESLKTKLEGKLREIQILDREVKRLREALAREVDGFPCAEETLKEEINV